ncbi:circadian locomoter output cycles protein kaput-like isoform X3 [Rhodnius prolixus]|uniref:circadian locomoter output cycles protein kaput-like isoform X3 n=1 Tax=Rhodnius prolixus TaxID=13249 RepID=UPI003D18DB3C
MSRFVNPSSTRKSDDTMDEDTDDKDDSKRKTRNLSEKKRRDQFNLLINELGSMVSTNNRKMDKSTVLKSAISYLKNHNDVAVLSRANEIQEDWKPSFLSNEEFIHLFLEALDGFIIVFSSTGRILYVSESVTSLLGYFPCDMLAMTLYDLVYEGDHSELYNMLLNPSTNFETDNELSFMCHCKRGGIDIKEEPVYEIILFIGHFRSDVDSLHLNNGVSSNRYSTYSAEAENRWVFLGTGRLQIPQLITELSVIDSSKCEFTSRHSLEWKFLFLDHRAPPIIGYLPFEVLGTSGYDYYHVDDLDKVVNCHETLMQKGECTSCYYRFLTKGQQWIWLQTRFYITYHQWNSKPEFIVCSHRVVSYVNVLKQTLENTDYNNIFDEPEKVKSYPTRTSPWSSKSSVGKREKQGGSDSNSMSAESPLSRHSQLTGVSAHSTRGGQAGSGSLVKNESKGNKPVERNDGYHPHSFAVVGVPPQSVLNVLPPQRLDQLERRQEELQQRIVEQQTELRHVTEQLFMAKYGLFPPVLNVTLPYTVSQTVPSSEMYVAQAIPPVIIEPHQVRVDEEQPSEHYQVPHQSGILYNPPVNSPNSTTQTNH